MSNSELFLKSSTKNPDLNLDKPSASCIWSVFVSNSSKLKDVTISKFSTLSSILPISLIVYLRLSIIVMIASLGSYRYAGNSSVATVIPNSMSLGANGFSDDTPSTTTNSPEVYLWSILAEGSRIILSVRGR